MVPAKSYRCWQFAAWGLTLLLLLLPGLGCALANPSNDREWAPEHAVLSRAEIQGNQVTIRNLRSTEYRGDQPVVKRYDKTVNLDEVNSVDFIVVPFPQLPSLAHTMLSFGFTGHDYIGVSAEIRKRKGDNYSPVLGALGYFELTYIVADERDLIGSRANQRLNEVYLYHGRATPEQARELFLDVMNRVNQLAAKPELYNTLTNNCTTNIWQHVNHVAGGKLPYSYQVLLPGYADRFAYDAGLIDTSESFEETKRRALVAYQAYRYRDSPDFSAAIRR
jgi:hypothetical protein